MAVHRTAACDRRGCEVAQLSGVMCISEITFIQKVPLLSPPLPDLMMCFVWLIHHPCGELLVQTTLSLGGVLEIYNVTVLYVCIDLYAHPFILMHISESCTYWFCV